MKKLLQDYRKMKLNLSEVEYQLETMEQENNDNRLIISFKQRNN